RNLEMISSPLDSPMCSCTSEARCFASPRNDGCVQISHPIKSPQMSRLLPWRRRLYKRIARGGGMDRIRIVGGSKLNGSIAISGAKNAALPLMIAALLTEKTLILDNVPRLADVAQLQRILGNHCVDITSVGKRSGDRAYQG